MRSNLSSPVARFFDYATWYLMLAVAWTLGTAAGLAVLGIIYCLIAGLLQCFGVHLWLPDMGHSSSGSHGCVTVGKSLICH